MDIFKKGVAISTWQCAPDNELSNWSQWAKSRWPFQWFGMKRVKDSIDDTPDFWNRYSCKDDPSSDCFASTKPALAPCCFVCARHAVSTFRYKEDIENAKKLGCNSFRLSLGQ